uniref:Uncharacterized protein n=1 Tax=Trypanosoma congolense (strain IL3000) TaxID=1068625 RepID=G0UIR9_TRYCI|nr:conserved hypothetical protein [Trypanosoma congolense IL3000]
MEAATPPPFFFTWKKGSPTVMETLYSKCMSALNLTDVDNFMIYDHTGFPLCSPRSVAVMMGSAIREKSNRVEVSVVKGHPCTSGLPLQCFFTWGTQQFVQTLVLRPNNILKDIRTALADECGLKVREANELSFSLFDQDECVGMELTPDNAYEELKRASEEKTVVHISVLDRRRTSLMAFSVRSLEEAATALADELELSHNCYLGDVRVTSVLRRCCEYSSPAEQDRVERYVDAIVEGMKGSGTLRREELVAAIVREASCCGQDVALLFVNRCIATTRLMLSHRPFDMLARFFRRLYRSLDFPGKAEDGIPLNVVLRQLAYAGLSDVGWLLFRGRSFPSVVSEWDFTEILQRLYAGNPNIVSRVAVASRLSGISSITNRHVITKEERELLQAECRHEMVHAFDGIQLSEVLTFVQQHKLHMKPQYCSLLGTVSTLLANYSQKLSSQWLVERCTARTGIPVDTMLRSFQDSQIPVPLLYQLCWDMLRPEVHYLTLLPDSCVASAFAYWALFAVQLVCANRNLEFPPVALVDLREFSWISRGKPPSCAAVGEAGGALSLSVPAVVPREGVVKKIKYKYSYLCRDLRREHHLQPIVK